ncbi:unnamed protein product, partial [Rotaria magnacalcarata]
MACAFAVMTVIAYAIVAKFTEPTATATT